MGGIDTNHSTEILPIEHFPSNMDANVYKARLKEVKIAFGKFDQSINLFGPEDVTLQDKDTYKENLKETRRFSC